MLTLLGLQIHRPCNHNRLIMLLARNSKRAPDKIQTKIAKRARRGSNSRLQPSMNRGQKRHSRKFNTLCKVHFILKKRSIRRAGEGLLYLMIQMILQHLPLMICSTLLKDSKLHLENLRTAPARTSEPHSRVDLCVTSLPRGGP